MRNLLRKLQVVPDPSRESSSSPSSSTSAGEHRPLLGLPGWLSSVTGRNPSSSSPSPCQATASSTATPAAHPVVCETRRDTGRDEPEARSVFDDEEYQIQLALELSAREDPEAVQIEAVKEISLGSCPPQNTPAEVVAFRYWNYNALSYDDKILDGFYDLYGVLSDSTSGKMPSLIDLQGTGVSDSVCWESVLVNRAGDSGLLKLEEAALVMALESKSGSVPFGENYLIQNLANLISDFMGGAVGDNENMLKEWRSHSNRIRMSVGSNVLPLGSLTVGLARHRALLFKVLADSIGIPCQLLKGKIYTGSDDGAMNIVKLNDGREYIVDLMTNPGTLIPSDAAGQPKELDETFFACSPSFGYIDNMISCSSGASSSDSSSSTNGSSDKKTSDGHLSSIENDKDAPDESRDGHDQKHTLTLELSSAEFQNNKINSFDDLKKARFLKKTIVHEPSLRPKHPYALARSPSWTEGIGSPAVNRMKVKDVSQYMIDATKENPLLAQKLHDVLLESGVVVPPNLFTECAEQQASSITERRILSEQKIEIKKAPSKPNKKSSNSSGDQHAHPTVISLRAQTEQSKSIICLGSKHPLGMDVAGVSDLSQSEASTVQSQASPIKFTDSMPVAAAVATAAVVASSMVVAVAKSNIEGNIDVPVAAAAATATAAAVVATTAAVSMQNEKLFSGFPFPISNHNQPDMCIKNLEEDFCGDQRSSNAQDTVSDKEESGEGHQEAKSGSSCKSTEAESVKSDASLDDVGEFEIQWEEIILGERIGLGSYGEVYHGDWHGTEVAVKRFLEQDISGDALEEFRSEVRIMKRLRHPNVVLFMGAVTRAPNLSIVTEFLPRGSLFRLIHRPNNQLDARRRLKMALDVARGMNYLHSCTPIIVHRDLKSPNLLVDKNWVVKVCDFGLSRIKHNRFLSSRSTAGTAEWMAPEVLRNEPSDEKCDVYSFGVILWELCTLQQPWNGMNPMQVVGAVGFQHRRLDIPDDIDPAIASIILKCWQMDPKLRPSFSEIMAELKTLQQPLTNSQATRQRNTPVNATGKGVVE